MESLYHIKTAEIQFPELPLKSNDIHKLRGYFGNQFKKYDLLHNHNSETGKNIYRYPAVQFKLRRVSGQPGHPVVIAYKEEGIGILKRLFLTTDHVVIGDRKMKIHEKQMEIKEEPLGANGQRYLYRFLSPWLALNQKNYREYRAMTNDDERSNKLQKLLIGNILSFCKFAGYTVKEQLTVRLKLHHSHEILKGEKLMGFNGEFEVNFLLPDYLGLGKSTSRGYGMIKKG